MNTNKVMTGDTDDQDDEQVNQYNQCLKRVKKILFMLLKVQHSSQIMVLMLCLH